MICPGCGGQVPEGSYQCPFCGAPLPRDSAQPGNLVQGFQGVQAPYGPPNQNPNIPGNPYGGAFPDPYGPQRMAPPPAQNRSQAPLIIAIAAIVVSFLAVVLVVVLAVIPKIDGGSAAVEEQLTEQQRDDSDDEDAVSSDDGDEADERDEADDRDEADERDDRSSGAGLASADDVAAEISASFDQVIESSFDIEKVRDWGVAILDLMPPEVEDLFELSGYTKDDIADALAGSFLSSDVGYYAEMLDLINFDIEFYVSGDMPQEDLDMVSLDMALLGISDEVTDGKWIGMRMTGSYGGESMSEETDFIGYCAIEIDGDWFFWSTSVDDGSVAEIPEDVSVS